MAKEEAKKNYLKRKFKECKDQEGKIDQKQRKQRKEWKRALNKLNRQLRKADLKKRWED